VEKAAFRDFEKGGCLPTGGDRRGIPETLLGGSEACRRPSE